MAKHNATGESHQEPEHRITVAGAVVAMHYGNRRKAYKFGAVLVLSLAVLAGAGWMINEAYNRHITVLNEGNSLGKQMIKLGIIQEGK